MKDQKALTPDNSGLSTTQKHRTEMIEAIASTMDLYGVNHTFGQLYGIMYFEDRPMTLEEMKEAMQMSKSNMSYAVRALTESQMIYKLEEKKERKDLYVAETNFYLTFQNFFGDKLQREVDVMTHSLQQVKPELIEFILSRETSSTERETALQDLHKLEQAEQYYKWLQGFVDRLRKGDFFEGESVKQERPTED
ncbi:GbsR/MarR family transcriptional regulator [Paenibacillus sp. FSL K6-1230]|uniref:GbsR/MarR family transcriptional regulator n=1 Tax=Paenibacillus sp. FSL K6-1230 TaxID=2921603 RepID=UPI0030FD12ED